MNYREIYNTLNKKQRNVLGIVIDRALSLEKLDDMPIKDAEHLVLYPYAKEEIGLNTDQLTLFRHVIRYIILRRDCIIESFHAAIRKEFFAAMDLLTDEKGIIHG